MTWYTSFLLHLVLSLTNILSCGCCHSPEILPDILRLQLRNLLRPELVHMLLTNR